MTKRRLKNCPEGLFLFNGNLFFKSEYRTQNIKGFYQTDAYVVASGEYFWGGAKTAEDREMLLVEPVDYDFALRTVSAQKQSTSTEPDVNEQRT